jgi:hypothetical protein
MRLDEGGARPARQHGVGVHQLGAAAVLGAQGVHLAQDLVEEEMGAVLQHPQLEAL